MNAAAGDILRESWYPWDGEGMGDLARVIETPDKHYVVEWDTPTITTTEEYETLDQAVAVYEREVLDYTDTVCHAESLSGHAVASPWEYTDVDRVETVVALIRANIRWAEYLRASEVEQGGLHLLAALTRDI